MTDTPPEVRSAVDPDRGGRQTADPIHRVNVGDSLTRTAAARPTQLAVVDGGRRLTYAQLDAWVNRIAHGLAAAGWARGDALDLASGHSA